MYLHYLSYLDIKRMQIIEILHHGKQGLFLSRKVSTMAADDLVTQGDRASEVKVWPSSQAYPPQNQKIIWI